MTESESAASSLARHARLFDAGAHVVVAAFLDGAPALALADGIVLIGEPDAQKRIVAHPDASILTAASDGRTLLTGGDDGRVVTVRADGSLEDIADENGKWIDALVSEGRGRSADPGMEGRPSRRHLLSRRAVSRDLDAGERAARLAHPGCA